MRRLMEAGGLVMAGLATALGTAILVTAILMLTGWDPLSLVVKAIVPVGAIGCGALAASGYYFGAKWLHQEVTKALLFQMVATAAATLLLYYGLVYAMVIATAPAGTPLPGFGEFLDRWLTQTHVYQSLSHQPTVDLGEAGGDAYFNAILEFVGLTIGGLWVVFALMRQPACPACGKYLRVLARKQDLFADDDSLAAYYHHEFDHPVDSAEFARHVGHRHKAPLRPGTIRVSTQVLACPTCSTQSVEESLSLYDGREWREADGGRSVDVPAGADVASAYRTGQPGASSAA